jgi:hypothetical protein
MSYPGRSFIVLMITGRTLSVARARGASAKTVTMCGTARALLHADTPVVTTSAVGRASHYLGSRCESASAHHIPRAP